MEITATFHGDSVAELAELGASSVPPCQLVVIEGPDVGRAVVLEEGREVVVGSAQASDLVLSDQRVSRRHLQIRAEGVWFSATDLGSKNGTLYEGSVLKEARVQAGATFKVGDSCLRIQQRPEPLAVAPSQARRFGELVAESLAMREVFAVLALCAAARPEVTVLLEGETGTGKELAARAIHDQSPRRKGPFVAVDCGALPESLLESELFGHTKGSFTGATQDRQGAFARAHGGTLFLDELGVVPLPVQARLLRVLEERRVRPVGADEDRAIDVRILAASPTDLAARVAEGKFRPDLFYRLSVVRVVLPPLRARREDIRMIVSEMLRRRGLSGDDVGGASLEMLHAHSWPGNVRELRNVIDRAIALSPGAEGFSGLRIALSPSGNLLSEGLTVRTDLPYAEARQMLITAFEQRYLRDVLLRVSGNISAASREMGLDRKHLSTLLKRHGLLK